MYRQKMETQNAHNNIICMQMPVPTYGANPGDTPTYLTVQLLGSLTIIMYMT